MRWKTGRRSTNIDDRRGRSGRPGRRVSRGVTGGGIGTLVLVVAALYFGVDPSFLLQTTSVGDVGQPPSSQQQRPGSAPGPAAGSTADFVAVVLADTEDVWRAIFSRSGQQYKEPTLVLFSDAVQSRCGFANAAVGPFYCPADHKVYLDLSFFRELQDRFGAPGDFAQAYVIAHEIGHHVQNLLGISADVQRRKARAGKTQANELSVRLELQADCMAGVWARQADRARSILETGDIEEALNAASAIGDDRLQRQAQGYVVPDSFTHGSAAQRTRWFRRGLDSGDTTACDTFSASTI